MGYLKKFVVDSGDKDTRQGAQQRGNPPPPPLGMIKVIHAASRDVAMTGSRRVLTVTPVESCLGEQPPEKKMKRNPSLFTTMI